MTMDERIAQLKEAFPTLTAVEDGVERELTPAEYEARIAEWATNAVEQEAREQEIADRKELAEQVHTALTLLDNGATLAQMRTILARLIRLLVRTGAIGP